MVVILSVCIGVLTISLACLFFIYIKEKKARKKIESKKIPEKDLKFIEFTVDMYIKYSKDLDIHSEEQHDFIIKELERIRKEHLNG